MLVCPLLNRMLKERSTDKVLRPKSAAMFREMRSPIHGGPSDRLINPLARACILDSASVDKNFGNASSDADGTDLGGAKSSPQGSVTDEDGCSVSSLEEDLLSNKQSSPLTPSRLSPVKTLSAGDSSPVGSSGSSQCTPRKPAAISTATPAASQAAAPDALLSRPPRGGQWAVRAPRTSGSGTAASSNTRRVFAPIAPLSATTSPPPFAESGWSGRLTSPVSDPPIGRVRGHSSSGIAMKPMSSLLQQQAGQSSPGHGGRVEVRGRMGLG